MGKLLASPTKHTEAAEGDFGTHSREMGALLHHVRWGKRRRYQLEGGNGGVIKPTKAWTFQPWGASG